MTESLRDKTVVITGGSSGMGLAAALAFAREGANVVVAARREEPLERTAQECRRYGVRALAFRADVTDAKEMEALAHAAAQAFGGIDLWINNAGLSLWGQFSDIGIEAQARLIQVNLVGVMYGTHAALAHMLARGGKGVIINMGSIGGRVPMPFAAAYSASKFGVKGFTEALRYELAAKTDIEVCSLYPTFVDTPTNIHSANYTGRALRPVPPVLDPERVAEAIVALARRPRRALYIGAHHTLAGPYAVAPEMTGRLIGRLGRQYLLESGPPSRPFDGTLFEPVQEGVDIRGGWGLRERRRARQVGIAALIGIAGLAVLAGAAASGGQTRRRKR